METFSALHFPRWILHTNASDAELSYFFDLRLNKRLSKQSWGWWFETTASSLWRHCNDVIIPICFRVISRALAPLLAKNSGECKQMNHSLKVWNKQIKTFQEHSVYIRWQIITDSKVHGANMGPTRVLSAPDGPHVGPMNLATRDVLLTLFNPHHKLHILSSQS